ncbi:class I SAM-dependent methyltransferase [Oribacterium sp. WCC10]|uniref:class I SAM-dependent methyltransferase n=1 Tax=Oribacterium sp. WCC10 TaxID=1855343 RepID=UPI0008EF642D|nr:class I SAM-dependent methyltransferase [Oribacterium sp. WCC10]SFG35221.1 23S rRNA (cytosine1962-C5)-methyltransferase [Oribacterium sp. WCC10]
MFIADHWKDYEVIDTSSGDKLERWGKYVLRRPDPQVIWQTSFKNPNWKKLNGHYHRSDRGGGEWEFFDLPKQWKISYVLGGTGKGRSNLADYSKETYRPVEPVYANLAGIPEKQRTLTFHLKPFAFKHTGLFPEQAANWDWFSDIIVGEVDRRKKNGIEEPVKVLNLFAYTGGATLAAAAAGAHVTHVDASKGMVQWAKENAEASGLAQAPIRWLVDDCMKFVEREIRRGNKYDAIIMDPPSYGRGPKGEIWKIEDAVYQLIKLSSELLTRDSIFFLINSYTTGLQPAVMSYMLGVLIKEKLGGNIYSEEVGLPVTETGLVLPCGCSGRWTKN